MRRNGLLVGGWAVATMLALVLGLQGIRSVSNSVTNPRPAPLSPASVKEAVQRAGAVVPGAASTGSDASGQPVAGQSSPASGSDGGTSGTGSDDRGGGSPAPSAPNSSDNIGGGVPPFTSSSSASGPDGTDSSSSSQPAGSSSSSSPPPPQDSVYQLVGGSVAVRFENGGATLLWAQANSDDGFHTDRAEESDGTVDVRFESPTHESRLRAFWNNGPQQEIEERAR